MLKINKLNKYDERKKIICLKNNERNQEKKKFDFAQNPIFIFLLTLYFPKIT